MKKKLLVALISAALVVTSVMPASAAVIENQGETNGNTVATVENTAEDAENTAENAEILADEVKNISIKAKVTGTAYNKVKVTWELSEKLDGYAVYRAASKSGKYALKKTTTGTSYIGSVAYGKTYYYKVRGYKVIDGEKVYTKYSSPASAKGKIASPEKITAVSAAGNKIKISWSKVSGVDGYKLYSATSKSGKYNLIYAGTKASYIKKSPCEKKVYFKVVAYKKINGKTHFSKYSKVVSGAAGVNSWTADRMQKDIVSWLSGKGYTVRVVDLGDDYHQSVLPKAGGNYFYEYEAELKEAKKDVLAYVKALEKGYKEGDPNMVSYKFIIDIDVVDAVNSYGVALDCANIFVTDGSDVEYNYLLSEEQIAQYTAKVLELVNQERVKAGVAPLVINNKLSKMAQIKAEDIFEHDYWDHTSPIYGSPSEMAKAFGITDKGCGENLCWFADTPEEAVTSWMGSEGHKANILNPKYTQIGLGVYSSKQYDSKVWVQEFIR